MVRICLGLDFKIFLWMIRMLDIRFGFLFVLNSIFIFLFCVIVVEM